MCDKIHNLRRSIHKNQVKEGLDLSLRLFHLKEINQQSLKHVLQILNRNPNCKHTVRIFNYLDNFNLRENHSQNQ